MGETRTEPSPADLSAAQLLAALPEAEQEAIYADLDMVALQYDWSFWGRPSQLLPEDHTWDITLLLAGRGFGKTRTGCEWVRHMAKAHPGSRGILVARTAADARDVLIDGESGILACSPPDFYPLHEPSKRRLTWPNGSTATMFSSEVPDALRGPQSHWSLAEELATWDMTPDAVGLTAWDNLRIATRLGSNPKLVAMTTPKRVPHVKKLLAEMDGNARAILRRGRTSDNVGNLAQTYLDVIYGLYAGTALETQELGGEMLGDVEGALWSEQLLEDHRVAALPPDLVRPVIIVAVDPSVAEKPRDECGIVVMIGTGEPEHHLRQVYVVADESVLGPPDVWAKRVAEVAAKWGAVVVAEINQGGGLVRSAIQQVNPSINVVTIHSQRSKAVRAERAQLASQQGRLVMIGRHPFLEDQLTTWDPQISKDSPDRLDALVHGANAVLDPEESSKIVGRGPLRTSTPEHRQALINQEQAIVARGGAARDARGARRLWLPEHMRTSAAVGWEMPDGTVHPGR